MNFSSLKNLSRQTRLFFLLTILIAVIFYKIDYLRNECIYFISLPVKKIEKQCFYYTQLLQDKRQLMLRIENLEDHIKNTQPIMPNSLLPREKSNVLHYLDNHFNRSLIIEKNYDGQGKKYCVISDKGLLGRISEEGLWLCRVQLITDVQSKIPVYGEKSGQQAILQGSASKQVQLVRIKTPGILFNEGELLYTSGICGVFPKNIPVARVTSTSETSTEIECIQDFSNINQVTVIFNE